jgi:DNA-binding MarR family transcriptional regulator
MAPADTPTDTPHPVVDLDRYVPAYLTWIANKLSRGASQHYLAAFDVGIETWRCLVLLAIEGQISAQQVSRVIGMDKASVSRCFKGMLGRGLITMDLHADDGRMRIATLTAAGRALHNQLLGVALAREQAFLAVLNTDEQATLIGLLRRLHENLPAVETATTRYVHQHLSPAAPARLRRKLPAQPPRRPPGAPDRPPAADD